MQNSITLMVGPSGSGKSTKAKQVASLRKWRTIILSRDKFREMLFSYDPENVSEYYTTSNFNLHEQWVTQALNNAIRAALLDGFNVIVDNTHLKRSYINQYLQFGANIDFCVVDAPLETCLARDSKRVRKVGKEVICRQYKQFLELKNSFDFKPIVQNFEPIALDKSLPLCYIFDIDGTLAIKGDRNPFDWRRVGEDTVNENIREILWSHQTCGNKIIICTGRDGICEPETKQWLVDQEIHYDEFHIRPTGNGEKDYIVKERMWCDIATRYNIVACYDDRDQVIDFGRKIGLTMCQVNYGNF